MPKLLMNGAESQDEQLREIVVGMDAKTWKRHKGHLLRILNDRKTRL
jgi:hypothetical protein